MHDEAMILKHPLRVRIFHYFLIISFLPLAVTGLLLYFKPFAEETMNLMMKIHVVAGVVLTLDAVAFFFIGYDRVVLFIKRVFTVSMNDVKWFAVLGGYPQKFLLGKKVPVPPMGKYNSGQKLFGICVLIGGTILIATGWVLWGFPHNFPRQTVALFGDLHALFGWLLSLFLLVHLFLGVYMFDDFKAMILHGKIPYDEAKDVSPLWVSREITTPFAKEEVVTVR
ncbi:MAG: cytochrome b/b6 domain-containing protein [Deltaproteobacteria bacterium]|nr:cytochrome b/b6 domain-containing protein [Deltaproteobacteria bacterium]